MTDVSAWLRQLGLEHYEATFRDNGIGTDVLRDLTDAELKELGLNLGDRKRFLKAIATLDAEPNPVEVLKVPTPAQGVHEAERRQLTVMFVDLVGSTALSAQFDPEDMRELMRSYQNTVAGEIVRFEGHVAQFLGDGVLAYFGWPRAHEDEAERAVRAALAVTAATARLKTPTEDELQTRIGIATGRVVVGDLIGEGSGQRHAVVGETPNLAARLQAIAEPGAVVIADLTRHLLGDLFTLRDLGLQHCKGLATPTRAFAVLGERDLETRFAARHAGGATPLVGRDQELGLLIERWSQAKAGEGQVVLVGGEAGIGKSRLTDALREHASTQAHTRLRYQCSPFRTGSALWPVSEHLVRAAGLERVDTAPVRLTKLERLLGEAMTDIAVTAPLIAALLAIDTGDRYPPLTLGPEARKARTLAALAAQLEGLAARQPVLMILEDAHWLDPTSQELFDLLVDRLQHLPVLLIVTFRPELRPPWSGFPHVTLLSLIRLDRAQGAAIVTLTAGGKALPAEVLEQILAKTDGVPLFIEELTKTVLESGLLKDAGEHYVLAGPLPPLAIPTTLQDSLMSRLDRQAPAKEVAQIGACIGREFSHALIAEVSSLAAVELTAALDQLALAELVFRRGSPPEASYTFKHALVQDAAQQSLLNSRRQQLHARIAQAIETSFPERVAAEPELLAQHYTEAGLIEPALTYWLRAGEQAAGRSANREAASHLTRGLDLLPGLADETERDGRELSLRVALGGPLTALHGYAGEATRRSVRRARELAERLGDDERLFSVLYGELAVNYFGGSVSSEDRATLANFIERAVRDGRPALRLVGERILTVFRLHDADLTGARSLVDGILRDYDHGQHQRLGLRFGHDPYAATLAYQTWTLWLLGYPEQAAAVRDTEIVWVGQLSHANSKGIGLCWGGALPSLFLRQMTRAEDLAAQALRYSEENGLTLWHAYGLVFRGWARLDLGQPVAALADIEHGLAELRRAHQGRHLPMLLGVSARAHSALGEHELARQIVIEAIAASERTGDVMWLAELHRIEALLLWHADGHAAAHVEAGLQRALDIARRQLAKSLELRAATSLAQLWAERGERKQAGDLLTPIYAWFTEGFDTPDLIEARALLEQLR